MKNPYQEGYDHGKTWSWANPYEMGSKDWGDYQEGFEEATWNSQDDPIIDDDFDDLDDYEDDYNGEDNDY